MRTYAGLLAPGALSLALSLAACGSRHFDKPMTLGGKEVSADVLEHGREAYIHNCRQCHGDNGDGNGPAALGLRPPPRDFTKERFKIKFAAVEGGKLPNDEDFKHLVKYGLHGTAMLPWDVNDQELDDIIQYIKTLSPRWQKDKPGEPLPIDPDPWKGDLAAAEKEGQRLYHDVALCATCHASYASEAEMLAITNNTKNQVRPNPYEVAEPKDSDYRVILWRPEEIEALKKAENPALVEVKDKSGKVVKYEMKLKIAPPDFLFHPLRAIHDDPRDPQHAVNDIYRTISAGVAGTAMPGFRKQGGTNAKDVWALAHYVNKLRKLRGTKGALELRQKLISEKAPVPPPPAPPPAPAPAPGTTPAPAPAPANP